VFKFTLLHNEGAAFSFLSDAGGWQRYLLVGVSTVVSIFIAGWLYRIYKAEKLLALSLAFILGGAIGNLVDRAVQGYVVDFIVVYYDSYYFPAFNIADSAITIGAGLLILDMFYKPGGDKLGQ
jgi:signal peptidase II